MDNLNQFIESLIFATDTGIDRKEIQACLAAVTSEKIDMQAINIAIAELIEKYKRPEFSFEIVQIDEKLSFLSKKTFHPIISEYLKITQKKRLSKAAIETLSIIAYKQPVSKSDIENIRGVNCDYTIQKLLEKDLVAIIGRAESPGRPLLYGTSSKFMDYFGLKSLTDLPKLKDISSESNEIGTSESIIEEALKNVSKN